MKYIETTFTEELSELLIRHKKCFTSDKSGIYIIDADISKILTTEADVASEDSRNKLITVL